MATLTSAVIDSRLSDHQAWQERHEQSVEAVLANHPKTAFENFAEAMGIPERRWRTSKALREWAQRNANRLYVPEELLGAWGIRPSV